MMSFWVRLARRRLGPHYPLPTRTPIADIVGTYVHHIRSTKTAKSAQTDVYYLREMFGPICEALEITSRRIGPRCKKRPPVEKVDRRRKAPLIEAACFEMITTSQISTFVAGRVASRGLAPKTANRYREILCRLFNWAMEQRGVRMPGERNPAAKVERYREPAPEIRYLSFAQIDKQLAIRPVRCCLMCPDNCIEADAPIRIPDMFRHAWYFLIVALAGWLNRQQMDLIAYLTEENRILREKLGQKRIVLTDAQKRRLAGAAVSVGLEALRSIATLFSPETLLKWHRMLVARKYDGSGKRGPKPRKANEIRDLVLKMKAENPEWGYGHIHGELKGLGYDVSWQTVRRIMIEHGLLDDPKHKKKMNWTTFIKAHFQSMAACDFFTIEAWAPKGLTRFFVFFVIDLASRRVQISGITDRPHEGWMIQQARNLTDAEDGFLNGKRFLIHDRDTLFTPQFRKTMKAGGVRTLKMPKQSPNLNAYSERFVQTIKNECTEKMIFFGENHLRHVIAEFIAHYNEERPHQGLGNRRINASGQDPPKVGTVLCRERLGGLLKTYYRKAA